MTVEQWEALCRGAVLPREKGLTAEARAVEAACLREGCTPALATSIAGRLDALIPEGGPDRIGGMLGCLLGVARARRQS